MGHGLLEHDRMVSANLTPWHSLGIVTTGTLSLSAALTMAHLDFLVHKFPAFTRDNDITFEDALAQLVVAHAQAPDLSFGELLVDIGFDLPIPDQYATVRNDIRLPLGCVGKKYTPFQNHEAFELLELLLRGGEVEVETAGSLKNGRIVWVLVRMHRDLRIDGDEHLPYILMVTTHDGTGKVRIIPTAVRVVCMNTLRIALGQVRHEWTASHTESITMRTREAEETLKLSWAYLDAFEEEVKALIDRQVKEDEFERILLEEFPTLPNVDGTKSAKATNAENNRSEVRKIYTRAPEVGEFTGTGWGVVQAFSTFDLWCGTVHGDDGNDPNVRPANQARRILSGDTMKNTDRIRQRLLLPA